MPTQIFGDKNTLQFEVAASDPLSLSLPCVDIHAAGIHLTANDNAVYEPSFIFLLNKALKSFRDGTRFQPRPDIFGELRPEEIHLILADGSDDYPDTGKVSSLWGFLEFGDTTLQVLGFLIPTRGRLYLTLDMLQPGQTERGEVRVAEVSTEALAQAMSATLEVVAADYEAKKLSRS